MKSFKKALAVLLSVAMLAGLMVVPGAAADGSPVTKDISGAVVTVAEATFNGKAQTPAVTVTVGGKTLVEGKDFKVQPIAKWAAGKYQVVIEGIAPYTGTAEGTFVINPKVRANGVVQFYAKPKNPKLKVSIGQTGETKKVIKTSWFNKKATRTYKIKAKATAKNVKKDARLQVKYKIISGPNGWKGFASVQQNGKITFTKGAPKGKYVVQVTSTQTVNFKKATKKVVFTIK